MNQQDLIPSLIGIALLALLLYVNIRATRIILRSDSLDTRKNLLIAGVWIVPFIGALGMRNTVGDPDRPAPEPVCFEDLPPEFLRGAAPARIEAPGVDPLPLGEHAALQLGLPLLNWRAINAWAAQAADPVAARETAHRAWLLHLREVLGDPFHVLETPHAFLLSTLEPKAARAIAEYIATARKRIARVLDGVARFESSEKSILLVFDDEADYYEYVGLYYPEKGEFAFSGGMYINAGCPHFVARSVDLNQIEPVIAHELTHGALHHLRLPRWLDEGLAVNTEERLTRPIPSLYTPQEMRIKHLDFWGVEEIQQFWSGASFFRSDDANLLSYDLARILVQQMGRDWQAFARFVNQADRADAGLAAARVEMGLDLPAWVCMLLDREPDPAWVPDASAWSKDMLDEGIEEDSNEEAPLRAAPLKTACDKQ